MRGVFGICLGILGSVHDAEDAAQEAFVRAFSQIHKLRSGSRFQPWIARTARNLCYDLLRRKKRGQEILSIPSAAARLGQSKLAVAPEEVLVQREDRQRLTDALARLPEKYRLPLLMYYFDGHSTDSVAAMLDVNAATVLTRLSRARKELRRMLQEQGGAQ